MRPVNPPELSLACTVSSYVGVPNTISGFIVDILRIEDVSEKISKLDDYVNRLQDEVKKIEPLKRREMPLCMILVSDVIDTMKEELAKCNNLIPEPVLEEFIPLKTEKKDEKVKDSEEKDINNDKKNWMSSVQLWNSDVHNNSPNTDISNNKATLKPDNDKKTKEEEMNPPLMDSLFPNVKIKTAGRAFMPFKGSTNPPLMTVGKEDKDELPGKLSLCMPEITISREELTPIIYSSKSSFEIGTSSAINGQLNLRTGQQQTSRKQRRCWSPELHRRFVSALEQLGGPKVATPKQIRELMQVDGLTNDEVKSHLQKYRLHTRKSHSTTNTSSKHGNSGSPTDPFHFPESCRAFDDQCMDNENEYDEKSESHSWRT